MSGPLPLTGSTVLDLSDEPLLAAGRYLAELGARVLRVEAMKGDRVRRGGPFLDEEQGHERSLRHLLFNAGKESIAVDLDREDAWDLIARLAAAVDVVVAPLEKSKPARAWIEALRASAERGDGPSLVDVVFRRDQPDLAVTDLMPVAAGGLLYCNGYPDRAPDYPTGKLAYKQGAFLAVTAASAMILNRRLRGGGADAATISLQEAAMSTTIQAANQNLWNWYGVVCERSGDGGLRYPVLGHGFGAWETGRGDKVSFIGGRGTTYETGDGRWVTFGLNPPDYANFPPWFKDVTGSDELEQEQWRDPAYRVQHGEEFHELLRRFCGAQDLDELVQRGQELHHHVLPVQTAADIAADEHLEARGFFEDVDQPALERSVRKPRSPYRSTAYEVEPRAAPALGAHTDRALRELAGMDADEIQRVRNTGLLGGMPERYGETGTSATTVAASPPSANGAAAEGRLPLAGYRVLDFCWMAAGPLITEILANLGADVVKIESASGIDRVREFCHPPQEFSIDTGAFFHDVNTGKRSLTLNLHEPEALALVKQMLPNFDFVTSNFAPGAMEKWGLSYDELRAIRPDIIVGTYPVMGLSGPKQSYRGIGNGVLALSGVAGHTGAPDRAPVGLGTLHTDFTLAPIAAAQLIAALIQREETGEGQFIELAQYEGATHLLDTELIEFLNNGTLAPRIGNRSREYSPHGIFPTRGDDRWVAIAVRENADWQALCNVMGRSDLATGQQLQTLAGRQDHEDVIEEAISAWTSERDEWEAAELLQQARVPASPAEHVGDIVERDAGMQQLFYEFKWGELPFQVQTQPFTWNGARLETTPSPKLGEHNEEILRGELGLDEERFVDLMVREVVY